MCNHSLRAQSPIEGIDMLLHLDCRAGVSGRMTLAALAHLGVDFAPLADSLAVAGVRCRLDVTSETRPAGPGCRVEALVTAGAALLRHPADFANLFEKIDMPSAVRRRAVAILTALAEGCAYAQQTPVDAVRFEDADAVVAVVLGTSYGLEALGVQRVTASALPWFSGWAKGEPGGVPLPAPATAYLLRGKPVFATDAREELITPVGAALVHALVDAFAAGPDGVAVALGTGYDARPHAAGLRAWLVEQKSLGADHALGGHEPVTQLESHIDHLNGEDLGQALTALAAMPEVLDVLWLPGVGKKNRPAGLLRVLCLPRQQQCVANAVLRHTHTLGLRVQTLERLVAPRSAATVEIAGQRLAAKEYVIDGQTYVRPEADALEEAARQRGLGMPALRYMRGKE